MNEEVNIERALPSHQAAVLTLATETLGWGTDERFAQLFRWKHDENPFGVSPRWVATINGEVVGFRTYLRWQFRRPDGSVASAVRAVDTATHPDFQGRGIFRTLTLGSLADLEADGIDFVFNTPNDQSRPGYLKMGWQVVGRPAVMVAPTAPSRLLRLRGARTAAELWSEESTAGMSAIEAFAGPDLNQLVQHLDRPDGMETLRTAEYVRWRYGLKPLHYRVVTTGDGVAGGVAVFRVRRRGTALEATVTDVLVPAGKRSASLRRQLLRKVARSSGADYVLVGATKGLLGVPAVPAPNLGPIVTWRALLSTQTPAIGDWHLTMGDLELF